MPRVAGIPSEVGRVLDGSPRALQARRFSRTKGSTTFTTLPPAYRQVSP